MRRFQRPVVLVFALVSAVLGCLLAITAVPAGTSTPTPKQKAWSDFQVAVEGARTRTTTKPADEILQDIQRQFPASEDSQRLETGIINDDEAPMPGGEYSVENRWGGVIGSEFTVVYAGGLRSDPSQGFVLIERFSGTSERVFSRIVHSPAGVGRVRIEAENKPKLVLRGSHSGRAARLDVAAARFE